MWDQMVMVGRIVRPQGNRGEVVVESSTDYGDERFGAGAMLYTRRQPDAAPDAIQVTSSREHDGRWVVALQGIDSIDAAESLRGLELRIPEADLKAPGADRHYVHDLVGCRVETGGGDDVGPVTAVQLDAGIPLLVIKGRASEILVPFTSGICRLVDTAAKRIVIDAPEGLLELNVTRASTSQAGKPQADEPQE